MPWPEPMTAVCELTAFQDWFGRAVALGDGLDDDRWTPALRRALAVHRNTTLNACCTALADNYPVVRRLCGDDAFFGLALAFVEARPTGDPRLNGFGEGFAAFLGQHPALAEVRYIADVAAVEAMVVEALFAPDAAPLSPAAALQALRAGGGLRLHPAARFQAFETPAASLWTSHGQASAGEPEPVSWRAEGVLVTRPEGQVQVAAVDAGTLAFLGAIEGDLATALGAAQASGADLSALASQLLAAGALAAA